MERTVNKIEIPSGKDTNKIASHMGGEFVSSGKYMQNIPIPAINSPAKINIRYALSNFFSYFGVYFIKHPTFC